jgi:hypothetical protein
LRSVFRQPLGQYASVSLYAVIRTAASVQPIML